MTDRPEPDFVDWSLTTWEGSRRAQLERWASMSLDQILEAQEDMAELSRDLARQSGGHAAFRRPSQGDGRKHREDR